MKNTNIIWLLVGLLALSGVAQADCNDSIPRTRPNSRYEEATPDGSEVRDKITGLVWQRCLVGMTWDGNHCTGTASTYDWQQALDAPLNATRSTAASGAAAEWRVPNHAELFSLAERACHSPAINSTWFPDLPPSHWAWSSSPSMRNNLATTAWHVSFIYGITNGRAKNGLGNVRLVRAGQ